ncbi:MAG: 23S rRNA (pseudouridine(1915)-N(3))-methyltransferase RlmH [Bacteroidaceae bacterium]|nr:23S rRNA (pseudouridine(1915)-N(3))-methyltransferase RlmH [Bacteroidaceae bacterium]
MKIVFVVVGRTTDKHVEALIADYAERVKHYVPFEIEVIPELKNTKNLTVEQQKEREGEFIRKQLRDGDYVILLDEHGREFRSVEFASHLQTLYSYQARRLVFIVGGPYGFAKCIYDLSQEKLSLSRMTFSHQMVRLFFVEQLYRALTILRGEPYHHE